MVRGQVPFERTLRRAEHYKADMTRFVRGMIANASESCDETKLVLRIRQEMERSAFDRVEIGAMGNVLGTIGSGPHLIAMDAHIDTFGVGNLKNWTFDRYQGMEDAELIGGRGASDQEGGMASMVHAGKFIKDLGLLGDCTLLVTGTVQEEDCDGLCWRYLIEQSGMRPECVVGTEPTDCRDRSWRSRAHGDPRRCAGPQSPRPGAGARRQRDRQDGADTRRPDRDHGRRWPAPPVAQVAPHRPEQR